MHTNIHTQSSCLCHKIVESAHFCLCFCLRPLPCRRCEKHLEESPHLFHYKMPVIHLETQWFPAGALCRVISGERGNKPTWDTTFPWGPFASSSHFVQPLFIPGLIGLASLSAQLEHVVTCETISCIRSVAVRKVKKTVFFQMTFWDFHLWVSALCCPLMNSEDISFKTGSRHDLSFGNRGTVGEACHYIWFWFSISWARAQIEPHLSTCHHH